MKYIFCILACYFAANVLAQDNDSEQANREAIRKKNLARLEALLPNRPKPTEAEQELQRKNRATEEKASTEFREQLRANIDIPNIEPEEPSRATEVEIYFDDTGAITKIKIQRSCGNAEKDVAVVNGLLKLRNIPASLLSHIKNDRTITSKRSMLISMRL